MVAFFNPVKNVGYATDKKTLGSLSKYHRTSCRLCTKVVGLPRIDEWEIEGVNEIISLTRVVNKFHCFLVIQ